jgi:hypothetical protein
MPVATDSTRGPGEADRQELAAQAPPHGGRQGRTEAHLVKAGFKGIRDMLLLAGHGGYANTALLVSIHTVASKEVSHQSPI